MTHAAIGILLLGLAMAAAQDGERDAAVALAKKTLCAKLGLSVEAVQVDKAEPVDWPDASLGCPEKGVLSGRLRWSMRSMPQVARSPFPSIQ